MTGDRLIKVDGQRLGHVPSFDGFRGLFVLQVVFFHAGVSNFLLGSPIIIDWFFVASGFLITTLLLDEKNRAGDIDMRRFYTRRVLRLFPAMYAMLAFFTLVALAVHLIAPDALEKAGLWWLEVLAASLYVYFLVAAFFPVSLGAIGHTWSLTIEEQFYFFWPMVLRRSLRRGTRRSDRNLIIGCVVFIAVFVALRMSLQHMIIWEGAEPEFADQDHITWQGVLYRIAAFRPDMIVVGCLTAFVVRTIPRPVPEHILRLVKWLGLAGWVGYVGFIVLGNRVPGFELFGGPAYQIALFMQAPMIVDLYLRPGSVLARAVSVQPLRWLGQRSYGIYLWHIPVLLPFLPLIADSHGLEKRLIGIVAGLVGVGAGLLSFRYVERPFLRLKETRFAQPQDAFRPTPGVAAPPAADGDTRTPAGTTPPGGGTDGDGP